MEKLREEVIGDIRACLISTKGKCDLRKLRSDYKTLVGCDIPFKKLNFVSLEDFLTNVNTLWVTKGSGGQVFVDAKPSEKTSHIVDMIEKQKTSKKRRIPIRLERRSYMSRPPPPSRWRPKDFNSKGKSSYENSPRLAAVSHNQFVNIPNTPKKTDLPPRFNKQLASSNSNNGDVRDLRHYLNSKKTVTFESDSSSSSSSERSQVISGPYRVQVGPDKVPHSTKTNRATLMMGIPRKNSPPVLSPTAVENLKNNSLAAVDPTSTVWDSWTSSEESDAKVKSPTKQHTSIQPTGDTIIDLYNFTQSRKLGEPVFKVKSRRTKPHKPIFYDCQIKVGTHTYSSYPNDFTLELAAKQFAAKLALDDLTAKYGKRKSLLLSTEQDILDRIPPIVEKHYNGIWDWQLQADYADLFKEELPMNWLEIIDMSPKISVEGFLDGKYVLRYCKPEDKGKKSTVGAISDVSVPSNTVTFGEDGTLIALITCAVSAREIWCRQIDTKESDDFHSMMQNFERSYTHIKSFEEAVQDTMVGGYYAAFYDNAWYRVRVFEINEVNVNCFFIDFGEEQLITKDNIYHLKRQFAKDQAQAFICRLSGLEELYEVSTSSEHLLSLGGTIVQMEADSEVIEKSDPNDPISVMLYDIERNVSINEELISQISIESASPSVNKNGITEAYVSHVESNGEIYVHSHNSAFEKLESLLAELEDRLLEKLQELPVALVTPANSTGRLYLAKSKLNDRWHRVRFVDWSPCGKYAQVYFVDYGNYDILTVKKEALYPIEQLSDVINQFPEQAVKVRMVIDSIPSDFVEKVNKLMPSNQLVLLKFVRNDNEDVPWVKFFKRVPPDNDLVSISESIDFESQRTVSNVSRPEKLQRLISLNQFEDMALNKNVPSTGILRSPLLPELKEYFDVKVPCAVNPWNFFVQPYHSNDGLSKLMQSLQVAYGDVVHSPLQIDEIKPGNIYASKHEDGCWYRTSVIKVIHSRSISVFYCDFGYYANLTLQQLIPLDSQFLDLPYQAIKAKLAGIKPKQEKWTMADCKYFQKLVCHKSFVSILMGIEKDELYRCDMVLNLKMIDTSTEHDVCIDQVLVRRDIAVETDV